MDDHVRKAIQQATLRTRRLLEADFAAQLEGTFDVLPDGTMLLQAGEHLSLRQVHERSRIVAAIQHKQAAGMKPDEAVADYRRDAAFTTLNRFAALKMLEARRLVQECITRGEQSSGYREFCGLAAGVLLLPEGAGYRLYLECLFDELSTEVKVLFNRRDAASILWPRRACLAGVLSELNGAELAGVWGEDETLGWIYQYYNDPAERKKLRDPKQGGSAAPRNSRELAVRNQFFTPRYVVEFLTDNALGRTWYEMTRGGSSLKERCRYLIRLPNEVFLKPGEVAPDRPAGQDQSQDELLKQTVFIAHRPLKDPRTIRVIDPACGSMHFGLYAFDLFSTIYDEAWDLEETLGPAALYRDPDMKPLHEEFRDKGEFRRLVPRLIVEQNLHGIDIDPRAVQIAALALWLRAQRAYRALGITPVERPQIRKTNVVCAESMPGEREMREEFLQGEHPAIADLVRIIWDKMELAGEAGSLLKIEQELADAIEASQIRYRAMPEGLQMTLFEDPDLSRRKVLNFRELRSEEFWERAEERVLNALQAYAARASSENRTRRRLFRDDAEQGFAFIDVCRKRYDVALMNPPFGDASLPSKPYIEETYGDTKGDVYKAFVECFQPRLVPAGYLGIISSRTGFFLSQSEDWRTRVVLRLYRPIALADLGSGVLDAMVEVAAYVLRSLSEEEARDLTFSIVPALEKVARDQQDRFSLAKWQVARGGLKRHQAVAELEHLEAHGFIRRSTGDIVRYTPLWHSVKEVAVPPEPVFPLFVCVRALWDVRKETALAASSWGMRCAVRTAELYVCYPDDFGMVTGSPFCYWATNRIRGLFQRLPRFQSKGRQARRGPSTGDDFRRIRLWWEPAPKNIGRSVGWVPFAKGGRFSRFYADVYLLVGWDHRCSSFEGFLGRPGRMIAKLESVDAFFRPGLTWPLRTNSLSFRVLPSGCAFGHKGPAAFCDAAEGTLLATLAITNSSAFGLLVGMQTARVELAQSFEVGLIQNTPFPHLPVAAAERLADRATVSGRLKRALDEVEPTSHAFILPALLSAPGRTLAERAAEWAARARMSEEAIADIQTEIDDLAFHLYGLTDADRAVLTSTQPPESTGGAEVGDEEGEVAEDEEVVIADASTLPSELLGYSFGCAFGRWDIRYGTGEKDTPAVPDPFAPLPVCPPGLLQNAQGLPVRPEDLPAGYPIAIPWDGILVDDPNHPLDIELRVRDVLETIWMAQTGASADAIEVEACALLGVKSLREWFRRPAAFFADHLKRYSKSRRQAPIYWPLSTPSGSYTLWLYYHRFSKDTLYRALELVKEKCLHEEREWGRMTAEGGAAPSASERKALAAREEFLAELRGFQAELERVAPLWKPDLNDGAILNYGPLWRMIAHKPWQKAVKAAWDDLVAGKFDWAHLAMHLWPERVVPKCATDRSLAIAHGLEAEFWVQVDNGKWQARATPLRPVAELVEERKSAAVKTALQSLLEAPAPAGRQKTSARGQR